MLGVNHHMWRNELKFKLSFVRLKQCQTTVVRQRAFLCLERCVGPALPRPLDLLSTDPCSILPPVPTPISIQRRQPPVPNSPSSKSFKTKNKPWTRSCRSCIHSETKRSITVRVSVAENPRSSSRLSRS